MKNLFYLFLIALGFTGTLTACASSEPLEVPDVTGPAFVLFYTDN